MFLVFESCIQYEAKNLDMVFRFNGLSLDDEWLRVRFVGLGGEVYNGKFICFKSRSTSPFPVECFIDDRFSTIPVASRGRPGHPCRKFIYESNRSSLAVDRPLHKVCVKEEE